jgi:hypothetical protein
MQLIRTALPLTLCLLTLTARAADNATPKHLVGQWRWGSINPVTYWDTQTGKYMGHGGGMSCTYVFDDAGAYKMYLLIQTNTYGWQKTIWTFEEGNVAWAGDKVTFTPTKGHYRCFDNRVKKDNYERPMTDDELKQHTKTRKWAVETRDGKPAFITDVGEKGETVFRRDESDKK